MKEDGNDKIGRYEMKYLERSEMSNSKANLLFPGKQ